MPGIGESSATLVDLATLGMSLRRAPAAWEKDGIVGFRLQWADRCLELRGRIAWREGDYVGIDLGDPSTSLQEELQETLEEMLASDS